MTTLTLYDTRSYLTYRITHDRGIFLGAEVLADGGGTPVRTCDTLTELPLPIQQKIETLLCPFLRPTP